MKLAITTALRAFMAKHRANRVHTLRRRVSQVVLNGGACNTCSELGAKREFVAVQTINKAEHFFFNNVCYFTNTPAKQRCRFQHWSFDQTITVRGKPLSQHDFKVFPMN